MTKGGAPRPLFAIMRSGSSGRTAVSGKHCVDVARVQVPVGRATSALLATHPRRDAHDPRRESTDSGRPGHWCSSPSRGPIPLRGLAGRGCAGRGLARRGRARRFPSLPCNAQHALNGHEARLSDPFAGPSLNRASWCSEATSLRCCTADASYRYLYFSKQSPIAGVLGHGEALFRKAGTA